jgi:hypothetical protein
VVERLLHTEIFASRLADKWQPDFLLNFLPHPPNNTPYFLHGTLAAPALS